MKTSAMHALCCALAIYAHSAKPLKATLYFASDATLGREWCRPAADTCCSVYTLRREATRLDRGPRNVWLATLQLGSRVHHRPNSCNHSDRMLPCWGGDNTHKYGTSNQPGCDLRPPAIDVSLSIFTLSLPAPCTRLTSTLGKEEMTISRQRAPADCLTRGKVMETVVSRSTHEPGS